MPDPTTPNLGLFIPLNGADIGTWDVPANANFTLLDNVLGANTSIGLTNLPVTLSAAQYNTLFIRFTGVLTGNVVITFPSVGRSWIVRNDCTGTFTVTLTCGGGATVVLSQGIGSVLVVADGTNMYGINSTASAQVLPPQGRLTLSVNTPVMTTSASGQTTVRYTPYLGQLVPLYDGTNFTMTDTGGELTQLTTDNTKSPSAVGASSNYDVFVWSDAGTIRATRGPVWTSATARGAGAGTTELVRVKGLLLNANAIANGPGASRGTYVGTIRSNAASTIDFTFGASASGGSAANLMVWNCYNRISVATTVNDSGVAYQYQSNTIRQARASTGNQINFVSGLAEDSPQVIYVATGIQTALNARWAAGIGLDTITVMSATRGYIIDGTSAAAQTNTVTPTLFPGPLLGSHYVAALQQSDGTNNQWFNANTEDTLQMLFRM